MLILGFTWFHRFRPFTTFHLVIVVLCAALIIGACIHGRRLRGTPAERQFRNAWALGIIAFQVFAIVWWALPGNAAPDGRLPLHLCRIATWVAAAALLTEARALRATLYFWGLGLCAQGFVTPLRLDGLASVGFWIFWMGHLQIVGSAIYDLSVLGFRPRLRDLGSALIASWIYVAAVVPVNLIFHLDYGYLGKKSEYATRNILDHLPPWPWRTILFILIAHATLIVLWLLAIAPSLVERMRTAELRGTTRGGGTSSQPLQPSEGPTSSG